MSLPLRDFRLGITESIEIWLDAVATARGCDKALVAREILQEWAKVKHREHTVAMRRLAANGLQPDLAGLEPADDGAGARGGRR